MNFDGYWRELVDRVYHRGEVLTGAEELFYRWSCIYGETMVDGIESYFERRFDQFDADIQSLHTAGFPDIAAEFERARKVMFQDHPLDEDFVQTRIGELLEESDEVQPVLSEIRSIYRRLIPRLEVLSEYRDQFGLRESLYSASTDTERSPRLS